MGASCLSSKESLTNRARNVHFICLSLFWSLGVWKNYCSALWRHKAVGFTTLKKLVFLGHVLQQVVGVWHSHCQTSSWEFEVVSLIKCSNFEPLCSRSVEDFVEKMSNWQARTLCCLISSRFYKHLHDSKFSSPSGMSHSFLFSFPWK